MKNILFLIGICCLLNFEAKSQNEVDTTKFYTVNEVSEIPLFAKDPKKMYRFFAMNVRYTKAAVENNMQGIAYVSITVLRDGTVTDIKISKSLCSSKTNLDDNKRIACESLDNEALRIVRLFPKWIPGKINGIPVNTNNIEIPINFILAE